MLDVSATYVSLSHDKKKKAPLVLLNSPADTSYGTM